MSQHTRIKLSELDRVLLKDGRKGTVMVYDNQLSSFVFEPDNEANTYTIKLDDIEKVIHE